MALAPALNLHSAHGGNGVGGLVRFHESEPLSGIDPVSRAKQAAAFDKISRSSLSWRTSRRSRLSSSRSTLVTPSWRLPALRSAWATQLRIVWALASGPGCVQHGPAQRSCADTLPDTAGLTSALQTPPWQRITCPRNRVHSTRLHIIRFENAIYTALTTTGTLDANAFVAGTAAADAGDRIVYDHSTGNLFYDSDGTGVQSQTLFATLATKPVLNSGEFQVA
jgi:hypothetical protein